MVVITKIDICPPQILQQTITQLTRILKSPGARKIPIFIKSREETIVTAVRHLHPLSSVSPDTAKPYANSYPLRDLARPNSSPTASAPSSKYPT